MTRIVIRKGQELQIRGKRYKVLDTNVYGGKYRYIVQDVSNGRVAAIDREVAVAAREVAMMKEESMTQRMLTRRSSPRQKADTRFLRPAPASEDILTV